MSPRSAFDAITPAFQHARQQLRSLQWSQWWRIAVLGLVTGELGSAGCNGPGRPSSTGAPPELPSWPDESLAVVLIAATITGVLLFAVVALLTYVNSVARFILIETVVSKRCEGLRAGWRKWRPVGRQFFVWQVTLQLSIIAALIVFIGVPVAIATSAGWTPNPRDAAAPMALGVVLLVGVGVMLIIAAAIVYVIAKDFVAPVMAVEQIGVREAWRRVLAIVRDDTSGIAVYLIAKVLLTIAAAIVLLTLVIVGLLPVFGAAAVFYGIGAATGMAASPLMLAVLAGLGVGLFTLLLLAFFLANVPFVVFFPAFALYFLAERYPPLEPWISPPSAS